MNINVAVFAVLVLGVVFLVFCILYLVWVYRRTLENYYEVTLEAHKRGIKKGIETNANRFVSSKVDSAISKSLEEAGLMITKNAKNVVSSMRKKSASELMEERDAEARAVAEEFDEARRDIEKYKAEKFEEIRQRANEIQKKVIREVLGETFDEAKQEKLIMKAIEDAKRSNIF